MYEQPSNGLVKSITSCSSATPSPSVSYAWVILIVSTTVAQVDGVNLSHN